MGDFVSPRRAVFDRLRRRIETYRRDHKNALNRNHYTYPTHYENQRQDTLLLHQKWLESKAKKASKNTRVNREPQTSNSTQVQTQPRGKKTKDPSAEVKSSSDTHNIEEHNSNSVQAQQENSRAQSKHSVSVNIEQIIKTPQSSGSQIEIKLKSTVHTSQGDTSTTQISTSTNICKEEPLEPGHTSNPSSNGSLSIGLDDVDELQEILDALEQEPDSASILKEFDSSFPDTDNLKKESDNQQVVLSNQSSNSTPISNTEFVAKQNTTTVSGGGNYFDSTQNQQPCGQYQVSKNFSQQQSRGMYATEGTNQYSNMNTPGTGQNVGGYSRPQVPMAQNQTGQSIPPSIPSFADTGPAAKTLQQMAAQHQSLNIPGHFTPESYMGDGRPANMPNYNRPGYIEPHGTHGMNGTYPNLYNQNMCNMPMYNMKGHEQDMKPENVGQMQYAGQTKPLSHYDMTGRMSSGNSLQSSQMHNQNNAKGQYSQASNQSSIQVTQSQQITVNNSSHARMNFSQTQQMQVHSNNSHPLTLNQQQSFHMGSSEQQHQSMPQQQMPQQAQQPQQQHHVAPAAPNSQGMSQGSYMSQSEQMKMQMYQEKLMHQHEIRSRMQQQQMHQQGQYSGRPPPSYQPVAPVVSQGGVNSNPLQTMQNMVEQTNQGSTDPSYQSSLKQNNIPGHSMPPTSHSSTSASSSQTTFPSNNQSSGGSSGVTSNSGVKAETSSYTSTIMRGQRPPNVNIGPEGLNISQPRMNQWRQIGPTPPHGGMHRPQTDPNQQMAQYQNYGGHMAPSMYPYRMQMAQQQSMHMSHHQQRLPMTGTVNNAMGHTGAGMSSQQLRGPAPNMPPQASVAMMMNQQQHMQQQMNSNSMVGGAMSHPHQPNTGMPNTIGVHPGGGAGHNPNFSLDFLDHHQQSGHSDLFDPVQNGNPPEFNFEDILGSK